MGTLNQFPRNNKASRVRGRPTKLGDESSAMTSSPAKRRIVDPVFGRRSSDELSAMSQEIVEMNSKAMSLYQKGDFEAASLLFEKVVRLMDATVIGTKDENTKPKSKNCAPPTSSYIYQRMDFDEGMNVYRDTAYISPADHPAAVESAILFNAGQARHRLRDYGGAYMFYRRALLVLIPSSERGRQASLVSSSQTVHRVVIPVLHNVGQLAYRQGNLREAMEFYELALGHCRTLHGRDDLSVGVTLNCLGVLYYHVSADESCRAMSYFQDALRILTKVLGPESAAAATTLNNLGRVLVQREDFGAAFRHYEQALDIRRKVLGTDDIDYAATAFNAGQSLHQRGEYDHALSLYKEFLRVAVSKFSKSHRDIAVVLSGIAQIHQERKEYDEALKLYQESLRVGRSALGNFHSEVAMLLNRLGNFHFEREEFDAALKAYKEGLRIERRVLEKTHPNVIVTLSNIAEIHRQKGKYARAIRLYTEAMELQKLRHGETSAEVAGSLSVIGLVHDQNGDSNHALKSLQEALVMRRAVLGDDHLDVSATLTYLGTIFYRRSMTSTALQLFTESLRIRTEKLGRNDRDVSFTLYNVGLCRLLQGDYKEAGSCFKETLRVERLVLGVEHKDVALTLFKLGEAYKADGELDAALGCFKGALTIEKQVLGRDDPATVARTLNEIGNVYLAKNDVSEMMVAFTASARIVRGVGLSIHSVYVSPVLKLYAAGFTSAASAA